METNTDLIIDDMSKISDEDMYIDSYNVLKSSNEDMLLTNLSWNEMIEEEKCDIICKEFPKRSLSDNLNRISCGSTSGSTRGGIHGSTRGGIHGSTHGGTHGGIHGSTHKSQHNHQQDENKQESNQENQQDILIEFSELKLLNINELEDINILKFQVFLLNSLRKEFKIESNIENIKYEDIMERVKWLLDTTQLLSSRNNLELFYHPIEKDEKKTQSIPRSSYKFCNYNFECEFNYNVSKYSGCYAQHYVYNLIWADIDALKYFIDKNKDIFKNEQNLIEIKKSINTISFVVNHMYDELTNVKLYNYYSNNKQTHYNGQKNNNKQNGKNKLQQKSKKNSKSKRHNIITE